MMHYHRQVEEKRITKPSAYLVEFPSPPFAKYSKELVFDKPIDRKDWIVTPLYKPNIIEAAARVAEKHFHSTTAKQIRSLLKE